VIAFKVIMCGEFLNRVRNGSSPNKIIRSKHDSFIVLTNCSAYAFKLGDRGGNFTDFTPESARIRRNSAVNSGS
jgi:hypothetical protein